MKAVARPYDEYMTIFHSQTYVAAFVLQDIIPAFFAPGDCEQEIQRLSQGFGQSAHVITGEPRPGAPHTVIATWGDVTLTPLDGDDVESLRNGHDIHGGLIIDSLADAETSAREGMPIYRIGGGAGYIWSTKYDDSGRGRLWISAVNASLIGPSPDQGATAAAAYAPTPAPAQAQTPAPAATLDPERSMPIAPPAPSARSRPRPRKSRTQRRSSRNIPNLQICSRTSTP